MSKKREEKKEKRIKQRLQLKAKKEADKLLRGIVYCPLCGRVIKLPGIVRAEVIKGNVTMKCKCGISVPV